MSAKDRALVNATKETADDRSKDSADGVCRRDGDDARVGAPGKRPRSPAESAGAERAARQISEQIASLHAAWDRLRRSRHAEKPHTRAGRERRADPDGRDGLR